MHYCKALLLEAKSAEDGAKVFRFKATSDVVDRQGEIVKADGWEFGPFLRNPVFMRSHDYESLPIGRVIALEPQADGFIASVVFDNEDPDARMVQSKYERGFLNAVSVGFRSLERSGSKFGKDPLQHTRQELLEISAVAIPANPEAVMLRALKLGGAVDEITKAGRVLSQRNELALVEAEELMDKACVRLRNVLDQVAVAPMVSDSPETMAADGGETKMFEFADLGALLAFVGK